MAIRLRLSLIVLVTTALLVIIGGAILEANLGSGIRGTVRDSLRQDAQRVQLDLRKGSFTLTPPGRVANIVRDQNIVQVISQSDRVQYATETSGVTPLIDKSQLALALKSPQFIETRDKYTMLLFAEPASKGGGVLVVGSSLDEVTDALTRVRDGLWIGGPLFILLAGLGGWLLAGKALKPVEQLRDAAEQISGGMSDQQLEVPRTNDEIERLGKTFNTLLGRLQLTLKSQKEFVAAASHELRTPLVAARAELEVAQLGVKNIHELKSSLKVIELRLAQLSRLSEDLLLLARGSEQALSIDLVIQRLEPLIAESLQLFTVKAKQSGIALVLDGDLSISCAVDSFRFRQVVDNLVENALQHASGSSHVEIILRKDDGFAVLEVKDSGPGFPEEFLPKAFDRFTRAKASRPRSEGGAGLGLPIVKMLVEAQGGTVEAKNRAGLGASIIVRFPIQPEIKNRNEYGFGTGDRSPFQDFPSGAAFEFPYRSELQ